MRLLFTLLVSLLALSASSQDFWELPPESSDYTILETFWDQIEPPQHNIWGDTVSIEGFTWREFEASANSSGGNPTTYLLRAEDGVWFLKDTHWDVEGIEEFPLFDWTAQPGDTVLSTSSQIINGTDVNICQLLVDSTEQVEMVDGSIRDVFYLTNLDMDVLNPIIWIEGIGAKLNLIENAAGAIIFDQGYQLICAHLNSVWVYESQNAGFLPQYSDCDWVTTSLEEFNQTTFSLYPNPADQSINLDFENPQKSETLKVSILDLQGREVKSVQIATEGQVEISVEEIPNGVYLLKLSGDQLSHTQRLVVRH